MGLCVLIPSSPDCQTQSLSENAQMSQDQIKGLETQNQHIRDRLSKIEGILEASSKQKTMHPLLIAVLTVCATGILWYWGWIGTQVVSQGRQITQILGMLGPESIKDASLNPSNPQSAKQVEQAIRIALKQGKRIDPALISDAGAKFIDASAGNQNAWNAALTLVAYRSTFNSYERRVDIIPVFPNEILSHFDIQPLIEGKPAPKFSHIALGVLPEQAARYENIGENLNPNRGSAEYALSGGAVNIDHKDIRHTLFDNVEIHYSGKPLILEDVVFSNCTFIFENTLPSRGLGQSLLAANHVSFQTKG